MKNSLVDFFVVGVARGGTTSLYNYLQHHPDIFLPLVKECNYFSKVESLDDEVYETPEEGREYHMKIIQSEEVYHQLFQGALESQVKGEVSPSYFWDRNAAKRIYDYNKDAKIIVTLRNPIERAHSHYVMHHYTGYDKFNSFEGSLDSERNDIWGGGNMYLEMGLYFSQLKPYYDLFGAAQIKVIVSEEWTKNSFKTLSEIYDFLGVKPYEGEWADETFNASKQLKNKGLLDALRANSVKKSLRRILPKKTREKIKEQLFYKEAPKQEILPETYDRLKAYYKDDIEKTEVLIGKQLSQCWGI